MRFNKIGGFVACFLVLSEAMALRADYVAEWSCFLHDVCMVFGINESPGDAEDFYRFEQRFNDVFPIGLRRELVLERSRALPGWNGRTQILDCDEYVMLRFSRRLKGKVLYMNVIFDTDRGVVARRRFSSSEMLD